MKRFIFFMGGVFCLITALHGQAQKNVSSFFGYPLSIGNFTIDQQTWYVNQLTPVNVDLDNPRLQIGDIPDQTVWHEGDVALSFFVGADALKPGNITYSISAVPAPKGEISIDRVTGRFEYVPDKADVRDFTVTFIAQADGRQPETQPVRFTIMVAAPPEFTAFGIPKTNEPPNHNEPMISRNKVDNRVFNNVNRDVYEISISGKELIFDSKNPLSEKLMIFNGAPDIFELNLYAERLVIHDTLHFPQTNVTIYAKEVKFVDKAGVTASIKTTPLDAAGSETDGAKAGDITLNVKSLKQDSRQIRFIATGGKGKDAGSSGAPAGKGGGGGKLISTTGIRDFCDYAQGSPGIKKDETGRIIGEGQQGSPGSYQFNDKPWEWLHPNFVSAVIKHTKDAYRNRYHVFAYETFSGYLQEIENYRKSGEWNDLEFHVQMELSNAKDEMQAMMFRIVQNLDFFGNPIGWAPMLSFEVNKLAFEQEIDRAIRVMYLNYWLKSVVRMNEEQKEAYEEAIKLVKDELEANIGDVNKLMSNLSGLQSEADILQRHVKDIIDRVERKRDELVAKAEKAEKEKNNKKIWSYIWGGTAIVAGAVATIFTAGASVGLVALGASIVAVSGGAALGNQIWADNINVEFNQKARECLNSIDFTSVANFDPSLVTSDNYSAENVYYNINQKVNPIIDGVENLQIIFRQSYINSESLQIALNRVAGQTCEFQPFVEELKLLNERKAAFIRELDNFIVKISSACVEIQNGIAAADGYRKRIDMISGKSDGSDLRAMQYLDGMDRRARERLFKYHYYMAKSYEYRLLESYSGNLDLEKITNGFIGIAELQNNIKMLDKHDFKYLIKTAYEDQLSTVTANILDKYNTNRPQLRAAFTFDATESDLAMLNAGTGFNLNIFERGMVLANHENARIVDFKIHNIKVRLEGNQNPSVAYFELLLQHSGRSIIRSNGENYWFDHINDRNTNPITWGVNYDHKKEPDRRIIQQAPSPDEKSLLYSILTGLDKTNEFVIFSRPGVWSDIRVSKNVPLAVNSNMIIEELTFELQYDFSQRPINNHNVDVYTAEIVGQNSPSATSMQRSDVSAANEGVPRNWLTPYIQISSPDINKRTDGRSPMYRTYNSSKDVTFTAPEEYGLYRFVNWTNRVSGKVYETPETTISITNDAVMVANYIYAGPQLSASPNPVEVGNEASERNIVVTAQGTEYGDIDWEVQSNNPEWISIIHSTASGVNNGIITISVAANTTQTIRKGFITIKPIENDGVEPLVVVVVQGVTISDHVLQSIAQPAAVTGLPNGTAKTAAAFGLPATAMLITNQGNVAATVNWNTEECSYNPGLKTAQTFTVNGTVVLPQGVVNPNNTPLTVTISVSVNATSVTPVILSVSVDPNTPLANIYPNPTGGMITLEFETDGVYHLTLADMNGKVLLRESVTGQIAQIDVSGYPAGVYLLTIDDGKRQTTTRVVKN